MNTPTQAPSVQSVVHTYQDAKAVVCNSAGTLTTLLSVFMCTHNNNYRLSKGASVSTHKTFLQELKGVERGYTLMVVCRRLLHTARPLYIGKKRSIRSCGSWKLELALCGCCSRPRLCLVSSHPGSGGAKRNLTSVLSLC